MSYVGLYFPLREVWVLQYTYRRGLLRCSFDSDGQCEGLNAWDEQRYRFLRPFFFYYTILYICESANSGNLWQNN